jgi:hypothetical protein
MISNDPGLRTRAALLALDFQDMFLKWGANQPPRSGLHASSLLVSENEWCTRRFVLADLFPDEAQQPELKQWQWKQQAIFENGWDLHRRWQKLFLKFGNVAYGNTNNVKGDTVTVAPELDLTHYDSDRGVYFSPDAILDINGEHHVVEIKGINHTAFESLTNDLSVAMKACETVDKAVYQANLYMHLLELQHAIILIEDKNNQDFRVWITEYDKYLTLPYIKRAYLVKGMITLARTNGTYPKRVCQSPDDALARKCPMRDCCFSR